MNVLTYKLLVLHHVPTNRSHSRKICALGYVYLKSTGWIHFPFHFSIWTAVEYLEEFSKYLKQRLWRLLSHVSLEKWAIQMRGKNRNKTHGKTICPTFLSEKLNQTIFERIERHGFWEDPHRYATNTAWVLVSVFAQNFRFFFPQGQLYSIAVMV